MAKVHRTRAPRQTAHDFICRSMADAEAKGTMVRTAQAYTGRRVTLAGTELRSMGHCSYLAMERSPELAKAAARALREYGTQFSISRVYLECPLYVTLEERLEQMTGRPTLVAPTTTLAHMVALPALVQERDALLIDQFAHASLHMATELLADTKVCLFRHNKLERVEAQLVTLTREHPAVWLVIDGLYSMLGDFAPFDGIAQLLARYPTLHVYVDDAHSTGWFGKSGRGAALQRLGQHPRVVVALSLNKSFGAAGGALALPTLALRDRLRRCGGPMLFSGPIPPPMLGAAVASAALHLEEAHVERQRALALRIEHARSGIASRELPTLPNPGTPIFFLQCDSVDQATDGVRSLGRAGFFVCPSAFPAVPVNKPGIRFTVSLHNELEDIDALLDAASKIELSRDA
jgi:7-keto-8-aminopelargonate synthetase-like enzyme